jgi:hypothetical protein
LGHDGEKKDEDKKDGYWGPSRDHVLLYV